ncbi:hypothetical protein BJ138DRAFT_1151967 [Hygrophoropsis aurantiaca]|uniref:Uncharacterized protein n=1 Tax=Hygrophoropsis aurantiaca TaxID=72124 RepID=A0ACB8ACL4_9AGAM|nr:hypothetical protein BJ138DRAFT_1151967 [Hygrophoropsis aurantiaca]
MTDGAADNDSRSQTQVTPPLEIEDTPAPEEEIPDELSKEQGAKSSGKKRVERRDPGLREREPGKSVLPFSRVQKIIKADKDLPIVAKDATFLISLATEGFIKRFSEACHKQAEREKRATVQHKDVASVVRRADEFLFLEEIISFTRVEPQQKRKPKALQDTEESQGPTLLDKFVTATRSAVDEERGATEAPEDIVMEEDGTMHA